jgi:hypothetical protein
MTAEELAALGYRPDMGSPALSQAAASVSPADLQQLYGNQAPQLQPLPQPQVDPAILTQMMGTAPSADQQNAVNANQLAMMANLGVLPQNLSSDPNGLIPSAANVVAGPDGQSMALPPNTGTDNTYAGSTPTPDPATASQSASAPASAPAPAPVPAPTPSAQPKLSDYDQFMIQRGYAGIPLSEKGFLQAHKEFHEYQLKQLELQDPTKQAELKLKEADLADRPLKNQNLQAQTAESQSKVIAGELAKQNAMDAVAANISELQTQRDNLQTIANHPALPSMVGLAGQYNPGFSDKERELNTYFSQIDGQKLIDGINKIKNESAVPGSPLNFRITQQEAMAVKDSVNRLKRSQSPNDYRNAITQYTSILDRAIAAKQTQLDRMPSVNQDLLKQFSYSPASAASGRAATPAAGSGAVPGAPSSSSAPVIKTIPGRGTFQSLGNGHWKQIQ